MLTTLTLAATLFAPAAPAPKDVAPTPVAPTGQPPRILELKPDADGKILVTVNRPGNMGGNVGIAIVVNGQQAPNVPQNIVVQGGGISEKVELSKLKDLTVTTAGGKEVKLEEALKALAKGGLVIVSTDGKKVSPAYLRLFKEEVLVLASPDLVAPSGGMGGIKFGVGNLVPAIPAPPVAPPPPAKEPEKK